MGNKRWFKFWAEYGFAHAVAKDEEYFYLLDEGNKCMSEQAREWAANTANGEAILDTGYRSFKSGFRRTKQLPEDIRQAKIKTYKRMLAHYQELLDAIRTCK